MLLLDTPVVFSMGARLFGPCAPQKEEYSVTPVSPIQMVLRLSSSRHCLVKGQALLDSDSST